MRTDHAGGVLADLVREHGALARQLAGLQGRVDGLLRQHAHQIAGLQAQNLRLRAQQVVWRTGVCWGLGSSLLLQPTPRRALLAPHAPIDRASPQAQALICQTGCTGHAHPWLDADGLCRRSGMACERMTAGPMEG